MATVTGSFIDRNLGAIQEVLSQALWLEMMVADPVFEQLVMGNAGLEPMGGLGRDLKFRKRYAPLAGTGVIRGGNMQDYWSIYGENTTKLGQQSTGSAARSSNLYLQSLSKVFPDPTNGAKQSTFGLTFGLYSFEFNIMRTLSQETADRLPSAIREFIVPEMRGLARRIAQFWANSYYSNSNNVLGTFPSTVAAGDINSTLRTVTFAPTERTTYRFFAGMEVDLWPSTFPTSGRRLNGPDSGASAATDINEVKRVRAFVANVDDVKGTVTIVLDPSDTTIDGSAATFTTYATTSTLASAFVTPANTYGGSSPRFANFFGWRKFMKWGNASGSSTQWRILDDDAITDSEMDFIDIRDHPEFSSAHFTVGGALTMEQLARHLENITVGFKRSGDEIDTLIASRGIWMNMSEQDVNRYYIDIGGRPGSLSGRGVNANGGALSFEGKTYARETSDYLEDGNMLGLRRTGNYCLATPPPAGNTSRGGLPEIDAKIPVEFVIPALTGGAMSSFPILRVNGQSNAMPTEAMMMPGVVRAQLCPTKQIRGAVWDGITTSRTYSAV